jgi:hypothetical protein
MRTRCKFKLDTIERGIGSRQVRNTDGTPAKDERGYDKYEPCEIRTLKMSPVYGSGDPSHENTKFWQASPSGSFTLGVVNLTAVEHMQLGGEYYIDITPAP